LSLTYILSLSVQFEMVSFKEYALNPMNYLTLLAGLTLIQFPAFGFVLEKIAGYGYLNDSMVVVIEILYLASMLVYPIVLI